MNPSDVIILASKVAAGVADAAHVVAERCESIEITKVWNGLQATITISEVPE